MANNCRRFCEMFVRAHHTFMYITNSLGNIDMSPSIFLRRTLHQLMFRIHFIRRVSVWDLGNRLPISQMPNN